MHSRFHHDLQVGFDTLTHVVLLFNIDKGSSNKQIKHVIDQNRCRSIRARHYLQAVSKTKLCVTHIKTCKCKCRSTTVHCFINNCHNLLTEKHVCQQGETETSIQVQGCRGMASHELQGLNQTRDNLSTHSIASRSLDSWTQSNDT